jgi:hypothetical protein
MIRMIICFMMISFSLAYPGHGTFRSQSTQGPTWVGTATIIKENMVVTVYPNYLDVELEWVFKADGTTPEQYADALEIVGNLTLERGSVVVGMLVWYKDKILKAKLKQKKWARIAYEQVVDRNSPVPPRPRDPVIFEKVHDDNYDISIFPVAFQGTRRLRMRYLVPLYMNGDETFPQFGRYGHFYFINSYTPTGVITIKKGIGIERFSVTSFYSSVAPTYSKDSITDSITIAQSTNPFYTISPKIAMDTMDANKTFINVCTTNSLILPGEFARINNFAVLRIIDSIKTHFSLLGSKNDSGGTVNIFASIGNGAASCSTGVTETMNNILNVNDAHWRMPIYVYSRTPINHKITWQVFYNGELFFKDSELTLYTESKSALVESKLYASNNMLSIEKALPKSMAATFGFVDTSYAFLALEKDSLSHQLTDTYELSGVPLCDQGDIIADSSDTALIPAEGLFEENFMLWHTAIKNKTMVLMKDLFNLFHCFFKNNKLIIHIDYSLYNGHSPFEISIYSIDGKCLMKWNNSTIGNARTLEWSPHENGVVSRSVIVRVRMGSIVQSKTIPIF